MMTTQFLLLSLVCLVQWTLLLTAGSAPNVIIIFVDDLGWPDAGAVWSSNLGTATQAVPQTTDLLTPRIDQLAAGGVRFTNGYVTCPVCSPSRAGLMTGRHQQRFGYEMNPGPNLEYDPVFGLPRTECTLGDRMKALGYATAWIGKSHLGALPNLHPVTRGFDEFFGFLEGHHDYCLNNTCLYPANLPPPWLMTAEQRAQLPRPLWDPIQRASAPLTAAHQPVVVNETAYLTGAFAREIVNYIETQVTQHPTQPFCIYAPFNAVHEPVQVPPGLLQRTSALFPGDPVDEPHASARHKLAGMVLAIDDAVGAIMDTLTAKGILENTLIFFSSDNGAPPTTREDFNGSVSLPLKGNKSSLYEGGIRVPYILHWKDTLTPRVVHAPVSTMDILPTCVDAAGARIPASWQLDGVSLLPYLRGQTLQEPHPTLFWRVETGRAEEMEPGPRAMRQGNWKIVKPDWAVNWELYDLSTYNGLRETENLADSHPEKLRELIPIYDAWAATLPRPRWDYDDPDYVTPTFVLQDVRVGSTTASYLAPEFLPGSDQVAWQDETGQLWRGTIDLATGFPVGTPVSVIAGLAAPSANNEGPQWGISSAGAALFYTKQGAGGRWQIWRGATPLTTNSTLDSLGPRVSQDASRPAVGMSFNRGTPVSSASVVASDANPASVTALPNQAAVERNGRSIPGTTDLVYVRTGAPTQLARFSTTTGTSITLTNDLGSKTDAWAFIAPEYAGELCYACVVDRSAIAVYRDRQTGSGFFDRVATLIVPTTETARFLFQMKPLQGARGFNGVSWFSCVAYETNDMNSPGASAVWLLGLGPDAAHRLPLPLPPLNLDGSQPRNDLCREWRSLALRVSDPAATGTASEPETVIGQREVFCYYTRTPLAGPTQLRLASTGLMKPDALTSTGFSSLAYTRDYAPELPDETSGRHQGGTETTSLVAHDGKLYAALSSYGDNPLDRPTWAGAQIRVKDSPTAAWRTDTGADTALFRDHRAVEVLQELTFTKQNTSALPSPVKHLVASLSDLTVIGGTEVSARTRIGPGQWQHSTIANTATPAYALCFAMHLDRYPQLNGPDEGVAGGREMIFAGLTNGSVYHGTYDPNLGDRLVWDASPDAFTAAPSLGPITGLADANGFLYAACTMRQDLIGGPVAGGIYRRDDRTDTWSLIYAWPTPEPVASAPVSQRTATALTTVPDPRGCSHEVLLLARSWPGVIERLDPSIYLGPTQAPDGRDNVVSVELDVRDFFARHWNNDGVRNQNVTVGYTQFTPALDPVTGQRVYLLGVWFEQPGFTGTHFLVRHFDGTWEAADVPGPALRGTRCCAVSPFAADSASAIYLGGYDVAGQAAEDTAWILRGAWNAWPALNISTTTPQTIDLAWPATSEVWELESSTTLTDWFPVSAKPTRSLTGTTLSLETSSREFFRLRKP